jgi:hypothetical protein
MAIGCGTREGAGISPSQKSNNIVHTRCIAGFLQRFPVWGRSVRAVPVKLDYTAILWSYDLLSGSEENFGFACFHGLIQRNSFISGTILPAMPYH